MTRSNDRVRNDVRDGCKDNGEQTIRSIQEYGANGEAELILIEIDDETETLPTEDGTRWIQSDTFVEVEQ
jgi:hypothetical protein